MLNLRIYFIYYVKSNQYAEVQFAESQTATSVFHNGWVAKENILFSCCLATLLNNMAL